MINEEIPDPLQQLQLIDSMINKARNRFSQNGHLYLLWGWTVFVCSISSYLLEFVFKVPYFWTVWLLTWVMLVYQVFYIRKVRRKRLVVTYTDDIIRYVWLVFLIVAGLMMAIVTRFTTAPHHTDSVFLVLYGIPTFLSGVILKFRPLVSGAIFCWTLAVASLFIPFQYHMLLLALAVVLAWIIPGYLLSIRFKRQNNMSS